MKGSNSRSARPRNTLDLHPRRTDHRGALSGARGKEQREELLSDAREEGIAIVLERATPFTCRAVRVCPKRASRACPARGSRFALAREVKARSVVVLGALGGEREPRCSARQSFRSVALVEDWLVQRISPVVSLPANPRSCLCCEGRARMDRPPAPPRTSHPRTSRGRCHRQRTPSFASRSSPSLRSPSRGRRIHPARAGALRSLPGGRGPDSRAGAAWDAKSISA